MASRITSKVVAALMFVSVAACGSKAEDKVKPLAGAGAAGNTAAVSDSKPADPAANGAGANTATPTATAEDAMKYIAENSNMLVVIDVKKMVASPLLANPAVKAEIDKMKEDEGFKKLTAAGIDPFTNVDKIIASGDSSKEIVVIVITGSFDAAKAGEAAKAEMAKEGKGGAVEVVGANTLIISEKADAIATAKSGKGIDGSPIIKEAMAMVDATRPFYIVANVPAEAAGDLKDVPVPGLATAKNAAFSLSFEKGLDVLITLQLGAEADATQAKAGIDGMLPMLAGFGLPPELTSAIKTEAKGTNLNISIVLSEDQLKKLEETAKQMTAPMPGGEMPAPGVEAPAPAEK